MGQKIKNKRYRKFLDHGEIDYINRELLEEALENIGSPHRQQKRAALIMLYLTGCRPVELLNIKANDVEKTKYGHYVMVRVPASKNGLARTLYLKRSDDLVKEFFSYVKTVYPDFLLFAELRSEYTRYVKTKNGEIKKRIEITDSFRYHVKKWFTGVVKDPIPPYFLRHNRLSQLSEQGVDMKTLQMFKGAKSSDSVDPYLHLSSDRAKKAAKHIE